MGRKQKYPEHKEKAAALMNELLDEVVSLWTSEKVPELKSIADEIEISPAKLRKLLITASIRDNETYFSSPTSDMVLKLQMDGKSVKEIQETLGLSYTSVQGYLPHKSVYGLDTMSAECERIRLFRIRQKAVSDLHTHLGLPDASLYLWKAIIAFQGYPFTTSGRGNRPGVKFTYEVSKPSTGGGRRYPGEQVDGYGNELWIIKYGERGEKSISRSSVDYSIQIALKEDVTGPKQLKIYASSYVYSLFMRFGLV